jgi:hypothetical protein
MSAPFASTTQHCNVQDARRRRCRDCCHGHRQGIELISSSADHVVGPLSLKFVTRVADLVAAVAKDFGLDLKKIGLDRDYATQAPQQGRKPEHSSRSTAVRAS